MKKPEIGRVVKFLVDSGDLRNSNSNSTWRIHGPG